MLYSHNLENEKLSLFTLFLDRAAKGESQYASIVNEVILETHKYATGEKNLYTINRDSLNIVLLLAELERDYFFNLNATPDNYTTDTYQHIIGIISQKQPSFVF